jgi:hypothetical protein
MRGQPRSTFLRLRHRQDVLDRASARLVQVERCDTVGAGP